MDEAFFRLVFEPFSSSGSEADCCCCELAVGCLLGPPPDECCLTWDLTPLGRVDSVLRTEDGFDVDASLTSELADGDRLR